MPVIACPGCGKKYNLPESAAGQVAACKCGKRFKVGATASKAVPAPSVAVKSPATGVRKTSTAAPAKAVSKPQSVAVAKSKPVAAAKTATVAKAAPAAAIAAANDDFWDEAVTVAKEPEPRPSALPKPSSNPVDKAAKKKPAKEKRVRWGFDWGKVAVGLVSFVFFGGLAILLVMSTGRFSRSTVYLAVPAIGGLITALSGLMGEDGIW